ncbi:hypothetical protein CEP52_008630 [Fusarium oligoseptatum]|uniref:RTM1 protein n=1 Tax=Fusarium oligoseptatum TaxID=2604345 RepID=A0A428TH39_9HYPO|nr:hypothetical protein CEP52_008630 [Fusarium oligoseptatum]
MTEYELYHYDPSFILAIIFIALFSVSTLGHLFQLFHSRTFFFIPFLIGCIFEAIGYAGRAISAKQTPDWAVLPYAMQSLLLLLGPTMLAASIYMALGRLIIFLEADGYSLVPIEYLTKTFVFGDVISFLAQSAGGGMLSQAKSSGDQKRGQSIIIVGLAVQLYFFAFFITVLHIFHRRINKNPTDKSLSVTTPWKRFIFVLYAASGFIMVRSIFRIVEYITGTNGPLQSTEIYIYVFDASLIFITTALFNIFHPGRVILSWKEPNISNTYDDATSIPLRSARDTLPNVTEPLQYVPIQNKNRSSVALSPVQFDGRSHTQSPPLRYHRQSQQSFSAMHRQSQAYASPYQPVSSMYEVNRMTGPYNPYSGNLEPIR